ncbi:MAG TPA: hypothetical protein VF381_03725 [Thermoanaerobaculia bacterium]
MNVFGIPEVARLFERMLAVHKVITETPEPEPGFLGLSHRKMRRTIARIRTGRYNVPPGELTADQIAEALERTIHWEKTMKSARAELVDIIQKLEAMQDVAAKRAMDEAIKIFHAARELAKEKGPDSDVAKSVEIMERAWRESFPRVKKRQRRKEPETAAGAGGTRHEPD